MFGTLNVDGTVDLAVPSTRLEQGPQQITLSCRDIRGVQKVLKELRFRVKQGDRTITVLVDNVHFRDCQITARVIGLSQMYKFDITRYKEIRFTNASRSWGEMKTDLGMYQRANSSGITSIRYKLSVSENDLVIKLDETSNWSYTMELVRVFESQLNSLLLGRFRLSEVCLITSDDLTCRLLRNGSTGCKGSQRDLEGFTLTPQLTSSLRELNNSASHIDCLLRDVLQTTKQVDLDLDLRMMRVCINCVKIWELYLELGKQGIHLSSALVYRNLVKELGKKPGEIDLTELQTRERLVLLAKFLSPDCTPLRELLEMLGRLRNMYTHTPLSCYSRGMTEETAISFMNEIAVVFLALKFKMQRCSVSESERCLYLGAHSPDIYTDLVEEFLQRIEDQRWKPSVIAVRKDLLI